MKLFGKFSEYAINDISLYSTPTSFIKDYLKITGVKAEVREHIPKKYKMTREVYKGVYVDTTSDKIPIFEQSKAARHKIVLTFQLGPAKLKLYSRPMNNEEIKEAGLTPIDSVSKKENTFLAAIKLQGKTHWGNRVIYPGEDGYNVK
jgi:hypothetical protein